MSSTKVAKSQNLPLVSCIMPTYNRRPFVPQAIQYFLRQDYPNRELIIVDDGTDPIADLVPADERISYIRQPPKSMLGNKRNLACGAAHGEIILHWDDDDWMADWRVTYQTQTLFETQADICGLNKLFFYDQASKQAWQYHFDDIVKPWLMGCSFCYYKGFWKANPFLENRGNADRHFVWSKYKKKVAPLANNAFLIPTMHADNSISKLVGDGYMRAYSAEEVRQLIGKDIGFYDAQRLQPVTHPYDVKPAHSTAG